MNPRPRAYIQIHIAVLLYGLTGIMGELISLQEQALVWWRMLLAAIAFLFWPGLRAELKRIPRQRLFAMMGIGCIVALHWLTFFGAIALTNVSVTLAILATTSFFTALLEPLILRKKILWYEVLLGVFVVPGVALVYSSNSFAGIGILVALLSAFLAALFSIFNKMMIDQHDPVALSFVELGSGWLFLTLLLPLYYFQAPQFEFYPQNLDWIYLLVLSLLCTSFAYVINLKALKILSTFSVNLTINLEPVYSIILAFIIFHENKELQPSFYIGAAIIILAVVSHPIINRFLKNTTPGKNAAST